MDSVMVHECLASLRVGDEDELYRPFGGGEYSGRFVRLFVSGDEAHVPRRDADEGGHIDVTPDGYEVIGRFIPCW
jgi:hypothetical protein